MTFEYRVTVIVPIYNQEPYLEKSVSSLIKQTMPATDLEILLIDDGSTDDSPRMCDEYAANHENVFVIHKVNGGLSDARNCGIDHARGKYLMYLDGDDYLKSDTCLAVADFFDDHFDEVDLVTYPSRTIKNGVVSNPHYRYSVFKGSGVFDLKDDANIFAGITRIEVCVKNIGKNNVRFSEDRTFRHEDQKYCTDILLDKLKVGFCEKGCYYYEQQPEGLQNTFFFSYYLFENTMAFWEEEFAKFEGGIPRYLQALYVSDINWKTYTNALLPWHYNDENFNVALDRIRQLLARVDSDVIVSHPSMDSFKQAYMLSLKPNCIVSIEPGVNSLSLSADGRVFYSRKKIEIILLRFVPQKAGFKLVAFLKSPCFQFGEKPKLYANEFGEFGHRIAKVPLKKSSWGYNAGAKVETNLFWQFEYSLRAKDVGALDFFVEFSGTRLSTNYFFMKRAIFSNSKPRRYFFETDGWGYEFRDNTFHVRAKNSKTADDVGMLNSAGQQIKPISYDIKADRVRRAIQFIKSKHARVWLYHDCHGVEKNNAYYQFIHDFEINDGIERYYVVNDSLQSKRHLFSARQMRRVIQFGGIKHKLLAVASERIITAYIEENNWLPFTANRFKYYIDLFSAKITYLQHGVLHSHQPWKYSADRLLIDNVVISTSFERDNLTSNYGFNESQLIKAGMPRYDYLDSDSPSTKRILFAPSWRKYLVRQKTDGQWLGVPDVFEKSSFFRELKAFINSPELASLLKQYGYEMDVKLHPILTELYSPLLNVTNPYVHVAPESVQESDYSIFITDFSSYRFDFVYLKRAIMYFFPDEDMFKSGMSDYRETDYPLEGGFGDMARNAEEAIRLLSELLINDAHPKQKYLEQMNNFFFYYDNQQCARIYEALMGEDEEKNDGGN